MNERTAVIIGASGLTGNHLVELMLNDGYFTTIRLLLRTRIALSHAKLQQEIVDFSDKYDLQNRMGNGDAIFCCIGTTQKKVKGDKTEYEKIDHDIPVSAAQAGIANGFKKLFLVSSVGADPSSNNFYLKLKGRTEKDIKQFPFESIHIFRPSMLLGNRKEKRTAEKAGQLLMQALSFLFIGGILKYHPVKARDVAGAMLAQSKKEQTGIHILEYREIKKIIEQETSTTDNSLITPDPHQQSK